MTEIKEKGIHVINEFVKTWTKKYLFQTTYKDVEQQQHDLYEFVTEFSLPIQSKPIPVATVKVFFYMKYNQSTKDFEMNFRFENDSLIHKPDRTLRVSQMEKWLEKYLEKKSMTSKIIFLGTEFEATRIKDPRLDKIFEQMNYKPEDKQNKFLSQDLLSAPDELQMEEKFVDEKKQIETMKKSMFDIFRSIDTQDLGVVSKSECKQVFEKMGLNLNEDQWQEILHATDLNNNGVIEYTEFIAIGAEIIYGIFMKNQAEKQLREREAEYLHQAISILCEDEIHTAKKDILDKCVKCDEDQENIVKIVDLQKILEEQKVLSESEVSEVMKIINKKYIDVFPYHQLYDLILELKVTNLKNGLMESSITKLEKHIRDQCLQFDKDKKGMIHITDLMSALMTDKEIILSKTQTYIIQSFVQKDENGMVNYILSSRTLAEMIKKFFTSSLIQKQAKLIQQGLIEPTQYMAGWTEENINAEMTEIFKKYDLNKDGFLDQNELTQCCKESKLQITEEEIAQMINTYSIKKTGLISQEEFIGNFYMILRNMRCQLAIAQLGEI